MTSAPASTTAEAGFSQPPAGVRSCPLLYLFFVGNICLEIKFFLIFFERGDLAQSIAGPNHFYAVALAQPGVEPT